MSEQVMHRREFLTLLAAGASCAALLHAHTAEAAAIPRLAWPTTARRLILPFGGPWAYGTKCPGPWKHTGIDIGAVKGSPVTAAEAGTVIIVLSDPQWKWWITIEHQDAKRNKYTTVYWHLDKPPVNVKPGLPVTRGQQIAQVADMQKDTHLHFGVRNASYDNTANRGALPVTACPGYPAFRESFQDPLLFLS